MRSFSKGWVLAGPYMFYYTYEREERPLEVEDSGDGSSLKLVDPKVTGIPRITVSLYGVRLLLGIRTSYSVLGVAPMGSSVGLSMLCSADHLLYVERLL